MPVGSQFLEAVAPLKGGVAAERFLKRRGGDGGYMVICQVGSPGEQAACRTRAEAADVRVAFEHNTAELRVMQLLGNRRPSSKVIGAMPAARGGVIRLRGPGG